MLRVISPGTECQLRTGKGKVTAIVSAVTIYQHNTLSYKLVYWIEDQYYERWHWENEIDMTTNTKMDVGWLHPVPSD